MSEVFAHSLSWEEGEVPVSQRFGDTFYSRKDGRAETAHVFLAGNGLPERFAGQDEFVIAELGFGTGLNFIETWRAWRAVRHSGQRLRFVSFEKFPIGADEMVRALARWGELELLVEVLSKRWAKTSQETGQLLDWQMDQQTDLCVVVKDACEAVPEWQGMADAWYLDGFSPARNPELWGADLMSEVFQHTASGGTFSTYSAAGWVRRNLTNAGFQVGKQPGFGGKREMLRGVKPERCAP